MKYIFSLWFVVLGFAVTVKAQSPNYNSCTNAIFYCSDTSHSYSIPSGSTTCDGRGQYIGNKYLYYYFYLDSDSAATITVSCNDSLKKVYLAGPFNTDSLAIICATSNPTFVDSSVTTLPSAVMDVPAYSRGIYMLLIRPNECSSTINFNFEQDEYFSCTPFVQECENCIGSFAPEPGKKYLVSCWVKEENASITRKSYTYPEITIDFPSIDTSAGPFKASGEIIDGWQRIEGEFLIPDSTTDMSIILNVTSGNAFFDDIRIMPFDGSMKTYVYDPVTLRLTAELDERNYATIYEYDEEGKLMRVKKETERGIMTIQENKNSIKKKNQ